MPSSSDVAAADADADFKDDLAAAINVNSRENGSSTPDFILAEYLNDCLAALNKAIQAREAWYKRDSAPQLQPLLSQEHRDGSAS